MNEKVKNEIDKACWHEQRQMLGNDNMKLKPYPEYRDSEIKWIGEIPEGWGVRKLKYICTKYAEYGLNISSDNYQTEGIRFIRTTDVDDYGNLQNRGIYLNKSLCKGYTLNCGDLLISRSGTIGRTFLFNSKKNGEATYAGYLVRFSINKNKAMPKYVFYFTKTNSFFGWLEIQSIETTIENVNGQKYANLLLTIPPLPDQIVIANFLDSKTAKIDDLIEKDKKLIELLKEKRTALINYAVTKGLDPNVKTKDSGIDWIGKIPEGWGVKKLKFVSEVYISNVDKKTYPNEHDVLLCNYIDVYKNEFITSNLEFMKATANIVQVKKLSINKNDVIITKDSETIEEIAIPAIVTEDFQNVVCGYHLAIIRSCKKEILGKYLFRLFQSKKFSEQFSVKANGVTRYGISTYPIKNIPILLPPKEEQERIVNHLDKHTIRIDKTIQKNQKKIELLKEYKKSLIHHTVTGKVDVRGA